MGISSLCLGVLELRKGMSSGIPLGQQQAARQYAYRELFWHLLEPEQVHDIRTTVQTGTPLGNDRFREQIEQTLGCKVGQARRGRPVRAN